MRPGLQNDLVLKYINFCTRRTLFSIIRLHTKKIRYVQYLLTFRTCMASDRFFTLECFFTALSNTTFGEL